MSPTSIYILRSPVTVEQDGEPFSLTPDDAHLVAALALAGPDGLPVRELARMLGADVGTLKKRRQRLTKRTGLTFSTPQRDGLSFCQLNFDDLEVDALTFLDLTAKLSARTAPLDRRVLDRARALWVADPPELGAKTPAAVHTALDRLHAAHATVRTVGKNILIVDDQVGEDLAALLRLWHFCDVAISLESFNNYRTSLGKYDLAVIDLHLSAGYGDQQGDTIVRYINDTGVELPVAMISMKPPENQEYMRWINQLGLVAFIKKASDGPSADLSEVAKTVNELLEEDPSELACERIAHRLFKLRRKARKRLERLYPGVVGDRECKLMNEDANRVLEFAERMNLAAARSHLATFARQWGE